MTTQERITFFSYYWSTAIEDDTTIIRVYGLMEETNENVCVKIKDFLPYVYVEFPEIKDFEWTSVNMEYVTDTLREQLKPRRRNGEYTMDHRPVEVSREYMHKLYYANYDVENKCVKKFPFLLMKFATTEDINQLVYISRRDLYVEGLHRCIRIKVHETNASPILQLTSSRNIPTAGWIGCLGKRVQGDEKQSYCQHEFIVSSRQMMELPSTRVARPLIMSYDLEVYSHVSSKMPVANAPEDQIFQISCVFHRFGEPLDKCRKYLLTFGEPIQSLVGDDVTIIRSRIGDPNVANQDVAEAKLIDLFIDLIRNENPNIITGFNIFGFDISYMHERAEGKRNLQNYLSHGMLKYKSDVKKEMKWSSSAFKNQKFEYIEAEGRLYLDLLPYIRRNYKFDNYRLKTIAEALVGSTKDPLTPKGIFKSYDVGAKPENYRQNGASKEEASLYTYSEEGRKKISICGKYCVQDSYLVLQLMEKVHAWVDLTELAKICNVSILDLYIKGQQIRVFSQIYKKCFKTYVVQRDVFVPDPNEHYQGAIVFDPVPGMYDNVIPFDFSSLYPTSIIAENIDFSTLVQDDNVPDRLCNVIEWDEHYGCEHDKTKRKAKTKYILCSHQKYRYLKEPTGILPSLLENLIAARKQTKKEIEQIEEQLKDCTDPVEKKNTELYLAVLDKRQLAFKVCANSGYGAMGVQKGYLPFMPGAKCTTAVGRRSIEIVAKYIPEKFGGKLIYGDTDSNYIHFPAFEGKEASEIWDYAIMVADETSKLFKKPMKLEFECKIYTRFLILTKKRYMCLSCKRDGIVSNKIDKKGVLLARRDNSKAVRDIYSNIILKLFNKEEKNSIIYTLLEAINKMCSGVLSSRDFVITKSVGAVEKKTLPNGKEEFVLTNLQTKYRNTKKEVKEITKANIGDYIVEVLSKDPDTRLKQLHQKHVETEYDYYLKSLPAQVQLAEKMSKRGQIVAPGSRMEYLVITDGSVFNIEKEKMYEKLEDIVYYTNHSNILQIDYLHYLNALANPMDEVLKVIYNVHGKNAELEKDFVLNQFKFRVLRVKLHLELKALFAPQIKLVKS